MDWRDAEPTTALIPGERGDDDELDDLPPVRALMAVASWRVLVPRIAALPPDERRFIYDAISYEAAAARDAVKP